jgi:hypothetical protein
MCIDDVKILLFEIFACVDLEVFAKVSIRDKVIWRGQGLEKVTDLLLLLGNLFVSDFGYST